MMFSVQSEMLEDKYNFAVFAVKVEQIVTKEYRFLSPAISDNTAWRGVAWSVVGLYVFARFSLLQPPSFSLVARST